MAQILIIVSIFFSNFILFTSSAYAENREVELNPIIQSNGTYNYQSSNSDKVNRSDSNQVDSNSFEKPSDEATEKCKALHIELGLDIRTSEIACDIFYRVYQTQDEETLKCIQKLKAIPGIDSGLIFSCFHKKRSNLLSDRFQACMQATSQQSAGEFWLYEEYDHIKSVERDWWRLRKTKNQYAFPWSRFDKFLMECESSGFDQMSYESNNISLIGVANFNSRYGVSKKSNWNSSWLNIGGLSGLAFDKTGSLVAISDEKKTSFLHKFQLVTKPISEGKSFHSIRYLDSKEIHLDWDSNFDFEDLFIFPDGKVWLSTDVEYKKEESGGIFGLFKKEKKASFLIEFDEDGKYSRHISTPEEFVPRFESVETPCFTYPDYGNRNLGIDVSGQIIARDSEYKKDKTPLHSDSIVVLTDAGISIEGKSSNKEYRSPKEVKVSEKQEVPRQKCYTYKQISGVKSNRAVEAFTVDLKSSRYWVSTEQPTLDQAEIKIFEMGIDTQKVSQVLSYPIAKEKENGLTAMLYHEGVFLTVERAHSSGDKEAFVNVYVSKINGNVFEKKLLIPNQAIKSGMAPGFFEVDNFEGIALGPSQTAGKKVLYLVSDNNFRMSQRTVFLMFELPEEMLK